MLEADLVTLLLAVLDDVLLGALEDLLALGALGLHAISKMLAIEVYKPSQPRCSS
jgi:hypothetical protein